MVEPANQKPFDQVPDDKGDTKGERYCNQDVIIRQAREVLGNKMGKEAHGVRSENQKFGVRHVDDSHLAKNDVKPQPHKDVYAHQAKSAEGLHHHYGVYFFVCVVAKHKTLP